VSALEELIRVASDVGNPSLEEWTAQGKKTVGFLCSHVPEEILYAADVLPYRLRAPGCTDTASADVYMGHVNCTFVRSCLEYVFDGRFDFLDGFVFTNSCDHSRRLYDISREKKPFALMHFLSVPHKVRGEEIAQWHRGEFAALKEAIEKTFGREVTIDELRSAICVYNESRTLLRELYDLRKADRPPLTGAETLSIVLAASSMPRGDFNRVLRAALQELRKREGVSGHRARLMVAGSGGCDDPEYYRVIEDQGGLIVTDSLCFGSRYFWNEVVEGEEDVLLALARSYLRRPSCANATDQVGERFEFIQRMTRDFDVDGVIFQRIRHCDLWGGQLFYLTGKMKEASIPLLSLEREYRLGATGQLRTRVQAFLESME
jgi:bzd-type benzoyl-CoA reductase N subunit